MEGSEVLTGRWGKKIERETFFPHQHFRAHIFFSCLVPHSVPSPPISSPAFVLGLLCLGVFASPLHSWDIFNRIRLLLLSVERVATE